MDTVSSMSSPITSISPGNVISTSLILSHPAPGNLISPRGISLYGSPIRKRLGIHPGCKFGIGLVIVFPVCLFGIALLMPSVLCTIIPFAIYV